MMRGGVGTLTRLENGLRTEMFSLGRELLELLLNDPNLPVPHDHPHDGERPAGRHRRDLFTDFGRVRVEKRTYYHNAQTRTGRFPLDEALRLFHGATPAFAQRATRAVAREPYEKACENLRREGLHEVTPDLLKGLCRALAPDAARFMRSPPLEKPRSHIPCVVTEADGTTAPMRRGELGGVKGRAPDGVAKGREVKLAVQYEARVTPGQKPARVDGSTRFLATLEKKDVFGGLVRNDHLRAYPNPPLLHLFLGDGAPWIWELRRTQFPNAVEILDFYHAALHLEPLLDAWGEEGAQRLARREEWKALLRAGQVDELIALCSARCAGGDAGCVEAMDKALGYYRANRFRMRYDEYLSKGWPIGSGVVEGGCKSVICERFKRSGMFWSSEGLEGLLPFRAALQAGRFDKLWGFLMDTKQKAMTA